MSPTPDEIRAAILRRRAAFVGTALAACGCTPSASDGATTSTSPVVTLPTASGEPAPVEPSTTASGVPVVPADQLPPYLMPSGISAAAKAHYERLNTTMQRVHGLLDSIDKDLPSCDLLKGGACEEAFGSIADRIHEVDRSLSFFHVCPGSSDDAKAYQSHHDAHLAFVRDRFARVKAAVAAAAGEQGADTWAKVQADHAQPHPCLSFACPDW